MAKPDTIPIENYSGSLTIGQIQENYGVGWGMMNYFNLDTGKISLWNIESDLKSNSFDIRFQAEKLDCTIVNIAHFNKGIQDTIAEDGEELADIQDLVTLRNTQRSYKSKAKGKLTEAIKLRNELLSLQKRLGVVQY